MKDNEKKSGNGLKAKSALATKPAVPKNSDRERQIALALNIFGGYTSRAALKDEDFQLLGLTQDQATDAEFNVVMSRAVNILAKAIAGTNVPEIVKWENEGA